MKKVFQLASIPLIALAFLALTPKNCPAPVVGWDKAFNYPENQNKPKKQPIKSRAPKYTEKQMKKRYPTQYKVYKAKQRVGRACSNAYKRTSQKVRNAKKRIYNRSRRVYQKYRRR